MTECKAAARAERTRCEAIVKRILERETFPVQRRLAREILRTIQGKPVRRRRAKA